MFQDFVNRDALDSLFAYTAVEVLVASSPKNVFYLTGSPTAIPDIHLLPWYTPSASSCGVALVQPDGSSLLFVEEADLAVSRELAWAPVTAFSREAGSVVGALAAYLKAHGFEESIVGYEAEGMTAAACRELRTLLPRLRLTPVDEALDLMRSRKTPGEIAMIKRSADILDDAMIKAFSEAREGDTEWDLHSAILGNALELGAEYCRGGLMIVEENGEPHKGVGERPIRSGDLIFADHATFLGGYPSNQSRHAIVGEASEEQARMYQITVEVERALIEYMRPGVTGRDVFLRCRELVAEYGMQHSAVIVGHSLGFGYQERPMITEDEGMALRDGNIIAIEPMLPPTQRYTVQDLVLIREGGNVLLSDRFDTDELFVIEGRR
jgi:Xaa-Pro aminopeptidase